MAKGVILNVLQNVDFTERNCGPPAFEDTAGVIRWWGEGPAWAPTFCVGGCVSNNARSDTSLSQVDADNVVASSTPGVLAVSLGFSTLLDPNVSYGGVMYTGDGFDVEPGDVWEISFGGALTGPYNLGGSYTGNSRKEFFVRIGGVFLDTGTGTYKVFAMNLPRAEFIDKPFVGSPITVPYDEQFQIPADWPPGRYQFAICTPGDPSLVANIPNPFYLQGIRFNVITPVLRQITGSAPPNSAGPATDTWVFVGNGASFPGNHPDYDVLKADGIQGVLWLDTDPNAMAGMISTRAAGLKAGIWTVAGNAQTAASFATQASDAVTNFTIAGQPPDILVMDAEVVAEGFDPSPGWTWCDDVVAAYRALQPTQLSAVSSPPLLGFPAPYNYGAFTAGGFTIWPQSYGAAIPADDIDPITTINSVTANGVDPTLVKVTLPGDPWGTDAQELGQHGIYSYAVFDAEIMLASGGGPPPAPPPPNNLSGLGGIEEIISSFPQPEFCPASPFPNSDNHDDFTFADCWNVCWGEWVFRAPYGSGFAPTALFEGHTILTGEGVNDVEAVLGSCGIFRSSFNSFLPADPFDFFFTEIGPTSTFGVTHGDCDCGWHYFHIHPGYVIQMVGQYDLQIGLEHASAGTRIQSPGCVVITPADEQRGGVFRFYIPPPIGQFEPRVPFVVTNFGTKPSCGATLGPADLLTHGPHAGSYLWQVYPVNGTHDGNNHFACEHYQIRLINPPVGGIPADTLVSNSTDPITTLDPFVLTDSWYTLADNSLGTIDLYLPTTPTRCYTVEGRTVCGGVIGPSFFCTVCLPGFHPPILDTEHRAAA